jgi:hypothetical protein
MMAALSGECFARCTPATFADPNRDCRQPHCQCLCHELNGRPR